MRFTRARYTIRRLMLAVGVVSLLMWPVTLGRYYGILAVEHDLQYSRVSIEMQGSQEWRERERLN